MSSTDLTNTNSRDTLNTNDRSSLNRGQIYHMDRSPETPQKVRHLNGAQIEGEAAHREKGRKVPLSRGQEGPEQGQAGQGLQVAPLEPNIVPNGLGTLFSRPSFYQPPVVIRETKMIFPSQILGVSCKQCSSCHGCR